MLKVRPSSPQTPQPFPSSNGRSSGAARYSCGADKPDPWAATVLDDCAMRSSALVCVWCMHTPRAPCAYRHPPSNGHGGPRGVHSAADHRRRDGLRPPRPPLRTLVPLHGRVHVSTPRGMPEPASRRSIARPHKWYQQADRDVAMCATCSACARERTWGSAVLQRWTPGNFQRRCRVWQRGGCARVLWGERNAAGNWLRTRAGASMGLRLSGTPEAIQHPRHARWEPQRIQLAVRRAWQLPLTHLSAVPCVPSV